LLIPSNSTKSAEKVPENSTKTAPNYPDSRPFDPFTLDSGIFPQVKQLKS
jgi:hypothetical protein